MSRRSSASRRPLNPPSNPLGGRFVRITHVRCPACEEQGHLNNEGRSRIIGGQQLRGATKYTGLTKASTGCELCEGTGSISTSDSERLLAAGYHSQAMWIDPYARKK